MWQTAVQRQPDVVFLDFDRTLCTTKASSRRNESSFIGCWFGSRREHRRSPATTRSTRTWPPPLRAGSSCSVEVEEVAASEAQVALCSTHPSVYIVTRNSRSQDHLLLLQVDACFLFFTWGTARILQSSFGSTGYVPTWWRPLCIPRAPTWVVGKLEAVPCFEDFSEHARMRHQLAARQVRCHARLLGFCLPCK